MAKKPHSTLAQSSPNSPNPSSSERYLGVLSLVGDGCGTGIELIALGNQEITTARSPRIERTR